ncbi:hypothetical protein N7528_009013 [Penicillium herquei]|nr:hypothetical protein N7528_009013 [Penicillium herquei]
MNDRALFSALISASLSHQLINGLLSGGMSSRYMEDTPHLQACYKETILALNDALRDPARATSDGTILAVLMTVEKPEIEMQKLWSQESPFQAPLQGLQWLNVHSAREPNLTHQNGLCRIIQLRGACDHPNISLDMKCTLAELASYTRSIESYVRGDTLRLDAQMMCDRRNLAQYNLMSIPSTGGQHHEDALSEICRIAAIIYSICVTFPLSGVGAPFSKLVLLLQSELKNSEILESDPQYSTTNQILLWVLTMGGIASIDKPERKWYVTALAELMARCQLSEWTDMKNLLKEILWLDSACNMPVIQGEGRHVLIARSGRSSAARKDLVRIVFTMNWNVGQRFQILLVSERYMSTLLGNGLVIYAKRGE